jgi:hypothetical protein
MRVLAGQWDSISERRLAEMKLRLSITLRTRRGVPRWSLFRAAMPNSEMGGGNIAYRFGGVAAFG